MSILFRASYGKFLVIQVLSLGKYLSLVNIVSG